MVLDSNQKSVPSSAGDQKILNQVAAISEQARQFYQQVAPEITNSNVRRYVVALEQLHQLPAQCNTTQLPAQATKQDLTVIWQWYHSQSSTLPSYQTPWCTELPQILTLQLTSFKRLSRELVRQEHARQLANLTASLQMLADELIPLLLSADSCNIYRQPG